MEEAIKIKTKDSDESAYLWTMDDRFSLCGVETTDNYNGTRKLVWFIFSTRLSNEEVERIRSDYRMGRSLVEPRKFSNRKNEIKNIIRECCSSEKG